MIAIKHTITRKGTGFKPRQWRQMIKSAWRKAGEYWHGDILERHFTIAAMREYHYAKRTRRYMIRKAQTFGHQRPLEFSGDLKREVMRTRDIRPDSKGAKIVLRVPAYKLRRTKGPNVELELMRISRRDEQDIAASIDQELQTQIDQAKRLETIHRG